MICTIFEKTSVLVKMQRGELRIYFYYSPYYSFKKSYEQAAQNQRNKSIFTPKCSAEQYLPLSVLQAEGAAVNKEETSASWETAIRQVHNRVTRLLHCKQRS